MVSSPATSTKLSRFTRSAARFAKGSEASQKGMPFRVALLQQRGGGGGTAEPLPPSKHTPLPALSVFPDATPRPATHSVHLSPSCTTWVVNYRSFNSIKHK